MDRLRCALAAVGHWQTLNFQGLFRRPAGQPSRHPAPKAALASAAERLPLNFVGGDEDVHRFLWVVLNVIRRAPRGQRLILGEMRTYLFEANPLPAFRSEVGIIQTGENRLLTSIKHNTLNSLNMEISEEGLVPT